MVDILLSGKTTHRKWKWERSREELLADPCQTIQSVRWDTWQGLRCLWLQAGNALEVLQALLCVARLLGRLT